MKDFKQLEELPAVCSNDELLTHRKIIQVIDRRHIVCVSSFLTQICFIGMTVIKRTVAKAAQPVVMGGRSKMSRVTGNKASVSGSGEAVPVWFISSFYPQAQLGVTTVACWVRPSSPLV